MDFDALLIAGPLAESPESDPYRDAPVPMEIDVPDGDLYAVFQQVGGTGTMVVEYGAENGGGCVLYARSANALVLLVRNGGSVFAEGLPAPPPA